MRQAAQAISGSSWTPWSTVDLTNQSEQYQRSGYFEDGDGGTAAAHDGSQYDHGGHADYGDSPRGNICQYENDNQDNAAPEGWKHATKKELAECWTATGNILDVLSRNGDPAYKWAGKRRQWWPPAARWSASGNAVIRFCTILEHASAADRKAACLWCDKLPESISNANYAEVVDKQIGICRVCNDMSEIREPVERLEKASVDQKAELTKSALAVAALGYKVMKNVPNDSAADWVQGTYFDGDLPD